MLIKLSLHSYTLFQQPHSFNVETILMQRRDVVQRYSNVAMILSNCWERSMYFATRFHLVTGRSSPNLLNTYLMYYVKIYVVIWCPLKKTSMKKGEWIFNTSLYRSTHFLIDWFYRLICIYQVKVDTRNTDRCKVYFVTIVMDVIWYFLKRLISNDLFGFKDRIYLDSITPDNYWVHIGNSPFKMIHVS